MFFAPVVTSRCLVFVIHIANGVLFCFLFAEALVLKGKTGEIVLLTILSFLGIRIFKICLSLLENSCLC